MDQSPDFSIHGYLNAIRRQKLLIAAIVILAALIGAVIAVAKKTQYSATASLSVTDPGASLIAGGSNVSSSTPLQLASTAAPQVTRAAVIAGAQRRLSQTAAGQAPTQDQIRSRISVTIDPNSYLVNVIGTGSTAAAAERVANAVADVDVSLTNAQSRASYAKQARAIRAQLKKMNPVSTQALTAETTFQHLADLASGATPLSVSAAATSASGPSTLKKVETILAAALLGLLIGIALATARDALDRRLRRPEDVTAVLDYPIVGSIRHEAMGHAGATASPANVKLGPLDDRDMESFRIVRQNLNFLAPGGIGKTVIVTSPMSAEGKSTVAAGLAASAAEAGKRALLVECDLRRPVVAERHGLVPTPGLTDFLVANAQPPEILRTVPTRRAAAMAGGPASDAAEQLVCITAGSPAPNPADLLLSDGFREFLTSVSEVYDLVILDTPPLLAVADTLELIPQVSAVLVCVRVRQTTRDQASAALAALARLPARPTGLVLTDVKESDDGAYYGYGYGYDDKS